MIVVEATEDIASSAERVLSFVMDIDRYRQVDRKIWRVRRSERHDDEVVVAMWTRVGPLLLPATQRLRLIPGRRIDVDNEPSWQDHLVDFHGEFICEPAQHGVRVTHRYTFAFKGLGRISEPLVRAWLRRDIKAEVERLREHLEEPVRVQGSQKRAH
ncbi:MAG: SRPBCC family protein [Acidimicrobiales bacterium]